MAKKKRKSIQKGNYSRKGRTEEGAAQPFSDLARVIKNALRARGITYRMLGEQIAMSESGVKKLLGGEDCSFQRLQSIAQVIGVSLSDLLEHSREQPIRTVRLTDAQQRYFVQHLDCFAFFWKLAIERMSVHQIEKRYRVAKRSAQRYLSALDDLGLIRLEADDRIRIGDTDLLCWSDEGPLMALLNRRFSAALIEDSLSTNGGLFRLHQLELREETRAELLSILSGILDSFRRRAVKERMTTAPDALQPVSLVLAAAPRSLVEKIE